MKRGHRGRPGTGGRRLPKSAWDELPSALGAIDVLHRVELKVMLDNRLREIAVAGLDLRVEPDKACEIYYWDDADATFRRQGLIIRSRLSAGGRAELVTKLRAPRPRRLPKSVARLPRLAVELDAHPHRTQWSASLKHETESGASGWRDDVVDWLSPEQRHFLTKSVGQGRAIRDVLAGDIEPRGPFSVLKLIGSVPRLPRFTVESWHFPDGHQLLELSVKCKPKQTRRTVGELRKLFAIHDLRPCRSQRTKTEISLRHLRWEPNLEVQPVVA